MLLERGLGGGPGQAGQLVREVGGHDGERQVDLPSPVPDRRLPPLAGVLELANRVGQQSLGELLAPLGLGGPLRCAIPRAGPVLSIGQRGPDHTDRGPDGGHPRPSGRHVLRQRRRLRHRVGHCGQTGQRARVQRVLHPVDRRGRARTGGCQLRGPALDARPAVLRPIGSVVGCGGCPDRHLPELLRPSLLLLQHLLVARERARLEHLHATAGL